MSYPVKLSLTTLLIFLLGTGISCCPEEEPDRVLVTDFTPVNADNSGVSLQEVGVGKDIPGAAYAIIIREVKEIISAKPTAGWGNMAKAKFCVDFETEYADPYQQIEVITINDFSTDFPAGSDISALFRGREYHLNSAPFVNLDELIGVLNQGDGIGLSNPPVLYLFTAPEFTGAHQFEVRLTLQSGQVFSEATSEINLI